MPFQRLILAVGVSLLFSMPVLAGGRSDWRHDSGRFKNTCGLQWVENSPDGVFCFREVGRSDHRVELYDRSRDCTVLLTNSSCYVRFGGGGFERYYYGHWWR
jgi:hypothetical protein